MSADLETALIAGVQDGWHAIEPLGVRMGGWLGCNDHASALCGATVRIARDENDAERPYSPGEPPQSHDPCPACMWEVAARTDTFEAVLATLADPLAHEVATAILNDALIAEGTAGPFDNDHALQVLTAVTRHCPVQLVEEGCGEGDCDHEDGECPSSPACRACSLQAGPWAHSWEGQYMDECTIAAPCAPLLAIAAHYGLPEVPAGPVIRYKITAADLREDPEGSRP